MKRKIQWSRTQMYRVHKPLKIVAGFGEGSLPGKVVSHHVVVSVIAFIILICLAFPVSGRPVSDKSDITAAKDREYVSGDVPKDIPGQGTQTSTLTISDTGPISDMNVKLNITHPFVADLDVYLIAPDGARIELFTDVGGASDDFNDTVIDQEAEQSITDGRGPFSGSYRPEGNLAELYGKDVTGTWTLEVTDDAGKTRAGTLNSWSLIVTIEVLEPLLPPVIQAGESVPGEIYDTVYWEDIGEVYQYGSDTPERIRDRRTLLSQLIIEDAGTIEDLNVMVNISHPQDSDLNVFLIAPDDQTRIELFTNVGESGVNFEDTVLDDEASVSITEGSAPFTGSYRPEGSLAELSGRNISGTWTLEITDDSQRFTGTLNSWSLIADLADIAYYGECANDVDFSNIISDSGWITDTSYTFTELVQSDQYWYRVKARPLKTWFQTSQEDFGSGVLTDTETTGDGDVVLPMGGGDPDTELHVIADPSFESDTLAGWSGDGNGSVLVGGVIENMLWASDGDGAGIVLFNSGYYYDRGDWGALIQPVDWTGVDTLVFDYASFGYANLLIAEVYIGDTQIWSRNGRNASNRPNYISAVYDVKKDVSSFEGVQNLSLVAQSKVSGWFDAGILWDNLRTYGPGVGVTSGEIISSAIGIGDNDTWHILTFDATTPDGTELTLDVLPAEGVDPIPGYVNIPSGTDLGGLGERTIRLRANLSTSNPGVSPMLHDWSISYTDAARESNWSNVVPSASINSK